MSYLLGRVGGRENLPVYQIYVRGHEPSPEDEPWWQDQDPPDGLRALMEDYVPVDDAGERRPIGVIGMALESENWEPVRGEGQGDPSPKVILPDPPLDQ